MDELEAITDMLRRQRRDLEECADQTATRNAETADVLTKLEELRRRAEETHAQTVADRAAQR
ncbi:MAG TPA: hypothetical protein VE010_04325 [Thermoanaerobaculia bacterium]|nr:hypothetical protein [Thermoanaerobaculia bacterium]